jgi:AcrR family transcriptional regulator
MILKACIDEFGHYGYERASTNRIVSTTGISKGSLFQYFGSKKNLYFMLLEESARTLNERIRKKLIDLPADILERAEKIIDTLIDTYLAEPQVFRLLWSVMEKTNEKSLVEMVSRIHWQAQMDFFNSLYDADNSNLKFSQDEIVSMMRLIFEGFRLELLREINPETDNGAFRKNLRRKMETAIKMLSDGIYK